MRKQLYLDRQILCTVEGAGTIGSIKILVDSVSLVTKTQEAPMEPTKPEFFCYRQGAPTELADAGREQEWPVIFRKSPKLSKNGNQLNVSTQVQANMIQ